MLVLERCVFRCWVWQVVLSSVLFVLCNWKGFHYTFKGVNIAAPTDPAERRRFKFGATGLLIQLSVAVLMQIGAIIFHMMYAARPALRSGSSWSSGGVASVLCCCCCTLSQVVADRRNPPHVSP